MQDFPSLKIYACDGIQYFGMSKCFENTGVLLLLTITGQSATTNTVYILMNYKKQRLFFILRAFFCVLVTLICTISLTVGWKTCRLPLNLAMMNVFWLLEVGRDYSLVLCYLL